MHMALRRNFSCPVCSTDPLLYNTMLYENWTSKQMWNHAVFTNYVILFNTFAPGLIQAVHAKTAGSHGALRGNFSGKCYRPGQSSKDLASLVVCTRKKFFGWGMRFFVSDVISVGLLGRLGPLCLALGANR